MAACREKDPDPEGKQLAATKDPLAEATKLVQQLKQYAGDRMKTHLLAFEVRPPLLDKPNPWALPPPHQALAFIAVLPDFLSYSGQFSLTSTADRMK